MAGYGVAGFTGLETVIANLTKIKNQLPFAMSLAVNNTAKKVQAFEVGSQLPAKLTLRNQWFKPGSRFGINIKFSTKENLQAEVGSRAYWLQLQEFGGTKKPKTARQLLIPDAAIRQTNKTLVAKQNRPKVLLANAKSEAFIIESGGREILFQRTGPGKRDLKPLYYGKPTAEVRKRLEFESTGMQKVKEYYADEFSQALATAIRTAY